MKTDTASIWKQSVSSGLIAGAICLLVSLVGLVEVLWGYLHNQRVAHSGRFYPADSDCFNHLYCSESIFGIVPDDSPGGKRGHWTCGWIYSYAARSSRSGS